MPQYVIRSSGTPLHQQDFGLQLTAMLSQLLFCHHTIVFNQWLALRFTLLNLVIASTYRCILKAAICDLKKSSMFRVSIEAAEYVAAPSSILQPAKEQIYNIQIKPHITSVYIIINATLEDGCI